MNNCKKFLLSALVGIFGITAVAGIAACSGGGTDGSDGVGVESVEKTGSSGLTDTYTITLSDGSTYTFTVTNGEDGTNGTDGESAYQLYVEAYGYTGTEAQWLEDLVNGKLATASCTVTFDTNGGSAVESQTVNKGDKVTEPQTTLTGYELEGWYLNGEKWSYIGYVVTENITLTANWVLKNQGLTFTAVYDTEDTEKIVSYTVSGYSGSDTEIEIPEYYNGYPVTSIAASVFASKTSITSVTIPETVTSIGANAFDGCTNLAAVTMPASLTTLGTQAFANTAVKNVYYNGGLTDWLGITYGSGSSNPMFYGAALYFADTGGNYELVESVTITGVTAINSSAFYGCTSLTSVTIGADVESIGDYAFKACTNLATVSTQGTSTLATVGTESFYGCTSLTSIDMPDSLTSISTYAFYNCSSLASITIPSGIETIGTYTFYGCSSLTSITIPDSVTTIDTYAFYKCGSLLTVTLGTGLTSIGTNAFSNSWRITEIYNYSSIELTIGTSSNGAIANYAVTVYTSDSTASGEFITDGDYIYYAYTSGETTTYYLVKYTGSETSLTLPTTINGQELSYSIKSYALAYTEITNVVIPENVSAISKGMFAGCSNLEYIVIPSSVTNVNNYAFAICSALTSIYYEGTATQYSEIEIGTTSNTSYNAATVYYYSESQPTESGNYWHYENGVPTVWTDGTAGE